MTEPTTGRRTVLLGVVGVGVGAGTLAACSSPPVPTGPAQGGTPNPAGTPVSEVPVGGGRIFPDQQVVVTQPRAGEFKAFSTTCTHQGCAVTMIQDGHIICPCHGSQFDITSGAPTPDSVATQPLQAKQVAVSGNTFTVS